MYHHVEDQKVAVTLIGVSRTVAELVAVAELSQTAQAPLCMIMCLARWHMNMHQLSTGCGCQ